ncbi:hypothetical protein CAEBREN_26396 [Caenorhabditis brenneri]|uniref:Uncharacterized protein n=1 Tax=Caenorhabditis brenneri TaxID=135651 RepID=G0NT12_CAEBE|nr:hypothetical protein CAEBREN_26396 [Caenorhabditis brenneri]
MIRSLSLILGFITMSVHGYQCQTQKNTINPPDDLSQSTYYPAGWTENQPIPTVENGQNCVITVKIPRGYYANVTFYRDFPYSTGSYALIVNNDTQPFFFMFPKFVVNLQTVNSTEYTTRFAFKIQWKIIPDIGRDTIIIEKKNPPVASFPGANFITFSGNQGSQLALMAFSLTDPANNYLLRQTAIFDGDSSDSNFIGTLDQVLTSKTPLIASRNKISVYTFDLGNYFYCPLFMAQDKDDIKGYQVYLGRNCEDNGECTVTLDGSLGNSLTVTESDGPEIIKRFNFFPPTATINVYENTVSSVTKVAEFNSTNFYEQLPFQVNGNMKFYELVGTGMYDMVVTREVSRAARLQL